MTEPSYAKGPNEPPLLEETIGENLDRAVERWGDREALVSCHQGVRYTYAELGEAVDRLARALLAEGVRPGDRLGIWSPNCAEWTLVQYATAKAGIVLVNINPAYRTSELEYALRQSGCRWLIAAPAFKTSDYAAMIESVRGSLGDLERVVLLGSPEWEALAAGTSADATSNASAVSRSQQTGGEKTLVRHWSWAIVIASSSVGAHETWTCR